MLKNFFKNSFEFTFLISAFLCLVHSPDLRAETSIPIEKKVDAIAFAPAQIWLSQLKKQIQNAKLDFDQQVDSYSYSTQDASTHIVSERVNMSAQFQSKIVASSFDNSSQQLSLNLESAKVSVSNFNLEVQIQKDLGFGTATFKLNMHCDAIELGLKNSNPISTEVKVNQGAFSVSQIYWDLRNSQIETKLLGCSDMTRFDQFLKDQIQQNIEKTFVLESLQQMVNQKINAAIQQKMMTALSQITTKLKIAQNQKIQFDDGNNLWIFSGSGNDQSFTPDELLKIKASRKAALLIKKQNLQAFAKDTMNDLLIQNVISSKKTDGMDRLTCSRFIQTFVWPSLKSLSKCFEMKIQIQVQSLTITDFANLKVDLKVGAWASGEGHQIAYFESKLNADLMHPMAEIISFKGRSNPDFIQWSGRSKRISTTLIQPSIEDLLQWGVSQFKENSLLKLVQKSTKLNLISKDAILVEVNI